MPNNQIEKGYDFTTGQLVTADNLDNLAQEATLKKGAISEQPAQTDPVASTDELLIHDVSDTGATKPKKATVSQILNANVTATFDTVNASSLASTSNLPVITTDGAVKTAIGFTYTSNNIVTVASTTHGLVAGDYIELTCSNTAFSGRYEVATVLTVDSFTYKVFGTVTATSGSCTWKKVGTISTNGNINVDDDVVIGKNLIVEGSARILGDKSLLIPKGTTAARPANAESGEIRYNSELSRVEVYNGTEWKEMGASPFDGTGGDIIIAPELTVHSTEVTFTCSDGINIIVAHSGHTVVAGQTIELITTQSGYSGEWVCQNSTSNTFTLQSTVVQIPVTTPVVASYRKSGNFKCHIWTTTGTGSFIAGNQSGYVEVLVVGAGGSSYSTGAIPGPNVGGGGGGVMHIQRYKINANQTISVNVGNAGVSGQDGGASTFGVISATGGFGGVNGGYSGSGKIGGLDVNPSKQSAAEFANCKAGDGAFGTASVFRDIINNNSFMKYVRGTGYISSIQGVNRAFGFGGVLISYPNIHVDLSSNIQNVAIGCDNANSGCGQDYNYTAKNGIVIVRYPYRIST